jgi:hypothetical protein
LITAQLCRWDGCALDVVPGFHYCSRHYLRPKPRPTEAQIAQYYERRLGEPRGKLTTIYAIKSGDAVKIGISWEPSKRFKELQTSTPHPLELLGTAQGVSPKLERLIHLRLQAHRLKGEWFRIVPEVQKVVDLIVAGDGVALRHHVTSPLDERALTGP